MDSKSPFRRAPRTQVDAIARVVEPGHPGSAAFRVVDLSEHGLFVADEDKGLSTATNLRIGLPNSNRPHERVWAWGSVAWHGVKNGKPGVGIALTFDAPDARIAWLNAVSLQRRSVH